MGTRFSWAFDGPRSDEGLPYDPMLELFRQARDEKRYKPKHRLGHPEAELEMLGAARGLERRGRLAGGR